MQDVYTRMNWLDNIPAELKALKQWVVVSTELDKDGALAKIPRNPRTQGKAMVNNPGTWASFDECEAFWFRYPEHVAGLGFVITAEDPYVFIDLDNKPEKPAAAGAVKWFRLAVEELGCYCETSISGHGAHALLKGSFKGSAKADGIELYGGDRYFLLTGDVWANGPIVEADDIIGKLAEHLGSRSTTGEGSWSDGELNELDERRSDGELLQHLQSMNNDIYTLLFIAGDSARYFANKGKPDDRSRADGALLEALCKVTRSDKRAYALFMESAMAPDKRPSGYRPKHKDYVRNSLARARVWVNEAREEERARIPQMDFSKLAANAAAARQAPPPPPPVPAPPPPPPPPPAPPVQAFVGMFPSGLVGELAQYFLHIMYRPVPEFALGASLAFFSAVCGRSYNFQNTGLNLYLLAMARSAFGKDGIHEVLSVLRAKLREAGCDEVDNFFAPAKLTAASALHRHLLEHPSGMISIGEVGHYFASLNNKGNDNMMGLRSAFLHVYTKSGKYGTLGKQTYSKKENDLETVYSPAVTLLGEGTRGTVFENLTIAGIEDGFLPRFIIFDVEGERPIGNHQPNDAVPEHLLSGLIGLVKNSHAINEGITLRRSPGGAQIVNAPTRSDPVKDVQMVGFTTVFAPRLASLEAEDNQEYNKLINDNPRSALQGRLLATKKRVAALVAIGRHPFQPAIDVADFNWAEKLVDKTYKKLVDHLQFGEIGDERSDTTTPILSTMQNWIEKGPSKSYRDHKPEAVQEMRNAGCVPYTYIGQQCKTKNPFKRMPNPADAVRKAVDSLLRDELLGQVNMKEARDKFGTSNLYYLTDFGQNQVKKSSA